MTLKFRIPKRTSFRTRLFIVMIGMLVIAGLMILGTTTIQYESQRENYHLGRLTRKEIQIIRHIDYLVEKHNLINKPFEVWNEFSSDFEKINTIHNIQYSLFNLEGNPLFIYHSPLEVVANNYSLSRELLEKIKSSEGGSYIEHYKSEIDNFHASYKILRDDLNRAYAILFFPYFEDISENNASKRAKVIADNLEVIREDFEVCIAVQKNYESGGYRSGPLSPRHEAGVAYFQQKLMEARA